MILVTGATGHSDTATIQQSAQRGLVSQMATLIRDESKADTWLQKGICIQVSSCNDAAS